MRILTGIQPSGKLHWGNYFGAMKSMFDLQEKGDNFMFIANFHAMTTVRDGKALRAQTRDVALDYLACGLDPAKTVVYRQSDVPEVQELAWYLSCLTPMGLLERCHSYKDKLAHGLEATHGLFAYPVLMAADILIMNADLVRAQQARGHSGRAHPRGGPRPARTSHTRPSLTRTFPDVEPCQCVVEV